MPRAGSPPPLPPGVTPLEPMNIGEVADPKFAVLPDPHTAFVKRSERLAALADGHELGDYLRYLSRLVLAQYEIQAGLPPVRLPPEEDLAQAREFGMPPLSVGRFEPDEAADATLAALLQAAAAFTPAGPGREAVDRLARLDRDTRRDLMTAVLMETMVEDFGIAERVLVAAALQVHFTRLAARLDADRLVEVADSACPCCGSAPVASMVVGWSGAYGSRYCCCSLCSTAWHVVRIRCLLCGTDKGIAYHGIEGGSDVVKAETCDGCHAYVKILHQHKDPRLEPFADDVASLGLDMLLREEDWRRASENPFLLGY